VSLSRRALLAGGLGVAALGAAGAVAYEDPPLRHRVKRLLDPVPEPSSHVPDATGTTLVSGEFVSRARGGRTVGWTVAYPPGSDVHAALPVALVLYGRSGDHSSAFKGHALDRFLADAVKHGTPPYALASADGGDHDYWHRRADGDDPQRMLLEEFLPMLAARGLRTRRIGLTGWSMGGYGALLLAEHLTRQGCAAVAVDSPALWTSAGDSAPGAFDNRADFERNDVFAMRDRLAGIPMRVAIGTSDPFYRSTRTFIAGLARRPITDFSTGGHDLAFWHHSAPAQLRFLGRYLH